MATLPTDYTDATTPTGATTEYPATTSRGLNATHAQINLGTQKPLYLTDQLVGGAAANSPTVSIGTARVPFRVVMSGTQPQLLFTNYLSAAGSVPDVDGVEVTFKASIEYPAGTIYPVTFLGQLATTLAGGGLILTDPIAIDLIAGNTVYVRVYVSTNGAYANRIALGTNSGTGGLSANQDLTAAGSGTIADSTGNFFMPSGIVGMPLSTVATPQAVLEGGDSIIHGGDLYGVQYGIPADGSLGGGGFVSRGLSGKTPWNNISVSGNMLSQQVLSSYRFRRQVHASYATHMITNLGINDVTSSATLAALQSNSIYLWQIYRSLNLKPIHCTLTPVSSSTDGWATVVNQTPNGNDAVRIAFNTWLRDGAPVLISGTTVTATTIGTSGRVLSGSATHPLAAWIDPAVIAESSLNSGKWMVLPTRTVTDGVAGPGTGGGFQVTSATANFTNADSGMPITISGAGVAGATYSSTIYNEPSSTIAGLNTTATSTNVTGATLVIGGGQATSGGTHPNAQMTQLLSAAVSGLTLS